MGAKEASADFLAVGLFPIDCHLFPTGMPRLMNKTLDSSVARCLTRKQELALKATSRDWCLLCL